MSFHGLIAHFFLAPNSIPLSRYLFIYSATKRHLGYFQVFLLQMLVYSLNFFLLNERFYKLYAATAKSLQSCLTLCHPIDGSPPGSPSLRFSRQEHWSGLSFPSPMHESEKWKWSHSVMSDSVTPWTAAHQASPSMGFSRQEYWSGVPLPSPTCKLV